MTLTLGIPNPHPKTKNPMLDSREAPKTWLAGYILINVCALWPAGRYDRPPSSWVRLQWTTVVGGAQEVELGVHRRNSAGKHLYLVASSTEGSSTYSKIGL